MNLRTGLGTGLQLLTICIVCIGASGCFNGRDQISINLGDVSIGQQLMDLDRALEADAISAGEHKRLRADLILLVGNLSQRAGDELSDEPPSTNEDDDEEDGFSWL